MTFQKKLYRPDGRSSVYQKWYKVKTYKEDYTNQQSFYSDLMENQMFYKQAKA